MTQHNVLPGNFQSIFDNYFAAPAQTKPPKVSSVLYLLRRDAAQCFGFDPNSFDVQKAMTRNSSVILWPGAMTVFAGIDLLSKFMAGTDSDNRPKKLPEKEAWRYSVEGRFTTFAEKYLTASVHHDAKVLYKCRCALDHSFALWAQARSANADSYSFTLGRQNNRALLTSRKSTQGRVIEATVYLYELHLRFETAVDLFRNDYHKSLLLPSTNLNAFEGLINKYGFIELPSVTATTWSI